MIRAVSSDVGEVLVNRARGASKSTDSVMLGLYFAYLGYRVIVYGPNQKNARELMNYLKKFKTHYASDFLLFCFEDDNVMMRSKSLVRFKGKGILRILNLGSYGDRRGPRADVVFYDEEREASKSDYDASDGVMSGTSMLLKAHLSTPFENSVFHKNYRRLKRLERQEGQQLVFEKPWYEIPRFLRNRRKYELKREQYRREGRLWEFRVEYECKFEMPSGRVFSNVLYTPYSNKDLEFLENTKLVAGIDWNPVSGHWLVAGAWKGDKEFIVAHALSLGVGEAFELDRGDPSIYDLIKPFFLNGNSLVIEKGGRNAPFVKRFKEIKNKDNSINRDDIRVYYESWDSQGENKYEACMRLRSKLLKVDENRFPELSEQVRICHWDESASDPQIAKDPADSPHALDALLHAVSDKNIRRGGYEVWSI